MPEYTNPMIRYAAGLASADETMQEIQKMVQEGNLSPEQGISALMNVFGPNGSGANLLDEKGNKTSPIAKVFQNGAAAQKEQSFGYGSNEGQASQSTPQQPAANAPQPQQSRQLQPIGNINAEPNEVGYANTGSPTNTINPEGLAESAQRASDTASTTAGWYTKFKAATGMNNMDVAQVAGNAALSAYMMFKEQRSQEKAAEYAREEALRKQAYNEEQVNRIRNGPLAKMVPFFMNQLMGIYGEAGGAERGGGLDIANVQRMMGTDDLSGMQPFDGWDNLDVSEAEMGRT